LELVPIFAGNIWSVTYDGAKTDEYNRLFGDWLNISYLSDFYDEHQKLLDDPFWKQYGMGKDDAVRRTRQEAESLLRSFLDLYDCCKKGMKPDFDILFRPLGEGCYEHQLLRSKAYGKKRAPSFLRIYAIKIESNAYVITGGAIKLTRTMGECPYLEKEFKKLNQVRTWLQKLGIEEKGDMENEQ
jgi:hypothetical protein